MENWYRLNKAELANLSRIDEPLKLKSQKRRASRPVVVVLHHGHILKVRSLAWYKHEVASDTLWGTCTYELRAMY